MVLSKNEKKIIEDNYWIVDEVMKCFCLDEYDVPDWYGAICVGLCIAASEYDLKSEIPFSIFSSGYIADELIRESVNNNENNSNFRHDKKCVSDKIVTYLSVD